MFDIVLYEPEIPPNTGNVIRLCANVGARLHLIEPLGFELDDKRLRRAGLDYHEWAEVRTHMDLDACHLAINRDSAHWYAFTTHATRAHVDVSFTRDDVLVFGPETRGLPTHVLSRYPASQQLRIPMRPGQRSLNLSNAVAVAAFEVWRQQGFHGAV